VLRVEGEPAYILHARPYRETSLLIDVLTPGHGRIGLVARGVRGPKDAASRALLQPFQPLTLSWQQRGELGQMRAFEAAGAALALSGEGLLAGFYLNELCQRLLPRGEALAGLFLRYAGSLAAAQSGSSLPWALRLFERDLLAACGYGLVLDGVAEGSGQHCHYVADVGPQPAAAGESGAIDVRALLALAEDEEPDPALQGPIRRLLQGLLQAQLGDEELRSRRLLREFRAGRPV
jgi:DNA repair protein RecO (recombination protein O)